MAEGLQRLPHLGTKGAGGALVGEVGQCAVQVVGQ